MSDTTKQLRAHVREVGKQAEVVGIIGRNRQKEEVIVRGKKMGKSRSSCLCLISG